MLPRNGGLTNLQISNAPDFTDRIDGSSCNRFAEHRPDELDHEPRSGQPPRTCRDNPEPSCRFRPAVQEAQGNKTKRGGMTAAGLVVSRAKCWVAYILAQGESGYRIVQRSTHRG